MNDTHCHFFSPGFFEALGREKYGADSGAGADRIALELGWEPPGSVEALTERCAIAELDRHRVSRVALIASAPGDEDSVAAAVAKYPGRFVGFFLLNPHMPDALDRTARGLTDLGLRCVCLFPAMHRYSLDDERVKRVFEVAAEHQGAVFAHCGFLSIEARTKLGLPNRFDLRLGDPLALASVASQFPTVPTIIPHFGAGMFREALMAAEVCPSIYLDTSSSNAWVKYVPGLTLTEVFKRVLAVLGPERVLFGTDSSFFPRGWHQVICGAQRTILDEIGVESAARRKILGENFASLFG